MIPRGRRFYKMSGSGNDFLFFDARELAIGALDKPEVIGRLCARGVGVGADGVVFLVNDATAALGIHYFNRDGSVGELCGNASLCTVRLAVELGIASASGFNFVSDAGIISGRIRDGLPEIDTPPVRGLRLDAQIPRESGELRMGFADTGVPHLVVLVDDTQDIEVEVRGRFLRHHPSLAAGANVNFVAQGNDRRWRIRTFERGVEAETLACGTGAVATAVMLKEWNLAGEETALVTRSNCPLTVRVRREGETILPSLRGEGRIVFVGELAEV